ncbi:ABC transporter ATP-binding protein [Bosea sp. (in: a-proteobacteria)]|uniref:ABC transporter ATP-binding protein n=1 Tax=Bosea sp. (in: a-proteobacteria) TaxID=1871050 RepID=UPI0025C66E43|nr:ABC transporter ATP-binding protein [Bosea sp. (in: a-proteobacteria)]
MALAMMREPMEVPAQQAATPLLSVRDVTLQYQTRRQIVTATYRVSFDVQRQDRFILLGPSGCGKSTLLKGIGGFLSPVEGEISLAGKRITGPAADRMMVFQEFDQLLPWQTVLGNVMFPMRKTGRFPRSEWRDRAMRAVEKVGLAKFADSHPHTLSGGMKQRVAIARALAMEPEILLMDEPFAALDALTRRRMQDELLELWNEIRFTLVFVTHSIQEAIVIGSRIVVMTPHPGQIRAELDATPFKQEDAGSEEFMAFNRKINGMLFGEEKIAHG